MPNNTDEVQVSFTVVDKDCSKLGEPSLDPAFDAFATGFKLLNFYQYNPDLNSHIVHIRKLESSTEPWREFLLSRTKTA